MYKLYIFDLDGTLLNTASGIIDACNYAAIQIGWNPLSPSDFSGVIGTPVLSIFHQYYGMDLATAEQGVKIFRKEYARNGVYNACVYPGITDLLSRLKTVDCKLAVATMKPVDSAETMLLHFNLRSYFDLVLGKGDNGDISKANMIESCLSRYNITPQEAVFIGDSPQDQQGAEIVKVNFIGVSYGLGFANSLEIKKGYHTKVAESVCSLSETLLNSIA